MATHSDDTLATLRSLVQGTPPITEAYLRRLAEVLGRQDYKSSLTNRMAVAGFPWSVTLEQMMRGFRYAAALSSRSHELHMLVGVANKSRTTFGIRFTGSVPDFALTKIQQAQQAGLSHFTIHSNQPLPTEQVMVKRDPVVIGWDKVPEITTKDGKKFTTAGNPHLRGIFVTGWDLEKEFQLPPPA